MLKKCETCNSGLYNVHMQGWTPWDKMFNFVNVQFVVCHNSKASVPYRRSQAFRMQNHLFRENLTFEVCLFSNIGLFSKCTKFTFITWMGFFFFLISASFKWLKRNVNRIILTACFASMFSNSLYQSQPCRWSSFPSRWETWDGNRKNKLKYIIVFTRVK